MRSLFTLLFLIACSQIGHAQWLTNSNKIYYNSGNVGLGTSNPNAKLHLWNRQSNIGNNTLGTINIEVGPDGYNQGARSRFITSANRGFIDYKTENGGFGTWIFGSQFNGVRDILAVNGRTQRVGIGTINPHFNLEVTGNFGTAGNRFTVAQGVINQNSTIENWASASDNGGLSFNYDGRQSPTGTSQALFRNFSIYNGKGQILGFFDGSSGNVGIGTFAPSRKLHISGGASSFPQVRIHENGGTNSLDIGHDGSNTIFRTNEGNILFEGGNVGIGTNSVPSAYKLAVDGKIIAEEINVQLSTNWPDYVFEEDYALKELSEVEKFITENGHLPNIPSAKEVENEGISLGEMNTKLLEKIEELTLYNIEQQKLIETVVKRIEQLENQ